MAPGVSWRLRAFTSPTLYVLVVVVVVALLVTLKLPKALSIAKMTYRKTRTGCLHCKVRKVKVGS